jgi:RNA polymerase sigma factor (sigma-70 family)
MQPGSGLAALLAGARASDPAQRESAFEELMSLVMVFVRSTMGSRLRDHRESSDVCQSIARSFVEDFDAGKVHFESEAALVAYLRTVVRTKLALLARHDSAVKRGGRAPVLGSLAIDHAHAPPRAGEGPPSYAARSDEATERALSTLTPDEQTLIRLRGRGLSWDRIAAELGRDEALLRKQFSRARERLAQDAD